MDSGMILTQAQYDVIAKVFRQADTEELGQVDPAIVPTLAIKVLGTGIKESEKQMIQYKAQQKSVPGEGNMTFSDFLELMSEIMSQTTRWGNLATKINGYVGFDTVQEQIKKKSLKRGFELNLMVVGESGLGKSTMINTLFKSKISRTSCTPPPHAIPQTIEVNSVSHVIEEQGVRLKLTVTDTPGFGDKINNDKCWLPILEYVNDQFDKYLNEEVSINRKKVIPDSRVHCCLYFIPPTGHWFKIQKHTLETWKIIVKTFQLLQILRPVDVEFMQHLHHCVNVVPIIAKSDTLTVEERKFFKQRIREDIAHHGIKIYPASYGAEDEEDASSNELIDKFMPFAVIGSGCELVVGGKKTLGRQTKWGFIEVENKKHCEFALLRDMLIKTHMQDLKEMTDKVHYENFRHQRLQQSQTANFQAGESNI